MSDWFTLPDACNGVHERFLAALREHTRDWPPDVRPQSSGAFLIDGVLTTYVDLADETMVVTSFRAEFDGSSVYANQVSTIGGLGADAECPGNAKPAHHNAQHQASQAQDSPEGTLEEVDCQLGPQPVG